MMTVEWSVVVPMYRVYVLSASTGRAPPHDMICADDQAAMQMADAMAKGQDTCEVWLDAKFIGSAPAQAPVARTQAPASARRSLSAWHWRPLWATFTANLCTARIKWSR